MHWCVTVYPGLLNFMNKSQNYSKVGHFLGGELKRISRVRGVNDQWSGFYLSKGEGATPLDTITYTQNRSFY